MKYSKGDLQFFLTHTIWDVFENMIFKCVTFSLLNRPPPPPTKNPIIYYAKRWKPKDKTKISWTNSV